MQALQAPAQLRSLTLPARPAQLRSLTLPARPAQLRSLTLPARPAQLRSLTLPARRLLPDLEPCPKNRRRSRASFRSRAPGFLLAFALPNREGRRSIAPSPG